MGNARFFLSKLKELAAEDRNRLMTYLVQCCFLVVVEASDTTAAYRIFAVMNDRGLNLSPTDILKTAQAGNYDFERKKSEYFACRGTSPFALTSQVLNEPVWTPRSCGRAKTICLSVFLRPGGWIRDLLPRSWRICWTKIGADANPSAQQ